MKYITTDNSHQLVFAETTVPDILPDECLIKVKAIGVNRADILQREGKYPAPKGESEILGLEVSGELIKCGLEAGNNFVNTPWQLGDKVFALVAGGGYAQYVKVKASQLFFMPDDFSFEQAAACAEVFLTAYQSLFTIASLPRKANVLIHAGASGVGSAAIQLAKANDCFVVTTVGSDLKAKACLALGADIALNYHNDDYVNWSKEHFKSGYDVIVDVVAGEYLAKNINVAAMDATIVTLSILGGRYCQQLDMAKLLAKRITLTASTLRNRSNKYKAKLVRSFHQDFYHDLVSGAIKPVIDSVYTWQDAEKAHGKMKRNENIGKLVLTVN